MARKRARNRHRRAHSSQFHLLNSLNSANLGQAIKEAHTANIRFKHKLTTDAQVDKLVAKTIANVDDFTLLIFPSIWQHTTANDFVKHLLHTLYNLRIVDTDYSTISLSEISQANLPIIRCQILARQVKRGAPFNAKVTVRSLSIARKIVDASPIRIRSSTLPVEIAKYEDASSTSGPTGKARDGLNCPIFHVSELRVGQIRSPNSFVSFWCSHDNYETANERYLVSRMNPNDATLQINPVERKLSITTKYPIPVNISTPDEKDKSLPAIVTKRSICCIRVEVPFNFISAMPILQRISEVDCTRAVCIPLHLPPRLYRTASVSLDVQLDDSIWDIFTANLKPMQWVRTTDPSPEIAFTRASALRFKIQMDDVLDLCRHFRNMGISISRMRWTKTVSIRNQIRAPAIHNAFCHAARMLNVPFSIRYMVACILGFTNVDPQSLDTSFWKILCHNQSEQKSLNVLGLMYAHLSGNCYLNPYDLGYSGSDGESYDNYGDVKPLLPLFLKFKEMCGTCDSDSDEDDFLYPQAESQSSDTESNDSLELTDFEMEETLENLQRGINRNVTDVTSMTFTPDNSVQLHETFGLTSKAKTHVAPIRRVLVTPSRVIAVLPELDLLNRVLRHYSKYRDRFIRVTFCDDDGTSIAHISSNDDLLGHVRRAVQNGIQVAGERFVFLAFSNSQLREHGIWMYNESRDSLNTSDIPPTADDIRAWMGNFSDIKTPGK